MISQNKIKNLHTTLILLLVFLNLGTFSQTTNSIQELGNFVNEYSAKSYNQGSGIGLWNESDITGSPYLSDEFIIGKIVTNNNITYTEIPLRYNIYNDNMEFKLSEDSVLAISNPGMMKDIQIGDEVFIYCYNQNNKGGYYSRKTGGDIQVLSKYIVVFNKPEPPEPFREAKPASFSRRANELFLKFGESVPVLISNKKDLETAFGSQSAEVFSLAKKEKLNFKKEADLIQLVNLLNQKD